MMNAHYADLAARIRALCENEQDPVALMATMACEVHHSDDRFDWTGFYRVTEPELLKIGPYQGGHGCLTIPFARGVCGAAARSGQAQIIADVNAFPGHIACASSTRSELVLPVWNKTGDLIAVFDIDSNQPAAFTQGDADALGAILAEIFTRYGEKRLHGINFRHTVKKISIFSRTLMLHNPNTLRTLGADLRALRKARGLSLADLAGSLGRSVGWLSQVERDLSEPSIDDLRMITQHLGIPISMLFGQADVPAEEQGLIVRRASRRPIGEAGGLIEELLSPDLTDDFEVLHSTFQPGAARPEPILRATQEIGYLVSGKLDLWIGERAFTIATGDSFRIRGEPYHWANPYTEPAVAIWVIAPPVY